MFCSLPKSRPRDSVSLIGGVFTWSRVRESICIFARVTNHEDSACFTGVPPALQALWNLPRTKQQSTGLLFSRLSSGPSFRFTHPLSKNTTLMGGVFAWSRVRESNPPSRLGKPLYYRYTNPAFEKHYSRRFWKFQPFFVDDSSTCNDCRAVLCKL